LLLGRAGGSLALGIAARETLIYSRTDQSMI
jgi:hypothetical protein